MKTAWVDGKEVTAGPEAPFDATCPDCGHPCTLRQRSAYQSDDVVWFYRHTKGGPLNCAAKTRPFARTRPHLQHFVELEKELMNESEYNGVQTQLALLADVVQAMPLGAFLEAIDHADTVGPILDPSL